MTATKDPAKPANYRWLIFGILAGGYVLVYFHRLCAAVVAMEMMQDLHTTGALLGLLSSAYFYPYALMQIPAGLLADTWGPRRTITVFFGVAFIGSLLLGDRALALLGALGPHPGRDRGVHAVCADHEGPGRVVHPGRVRGHDPSPAG